jgi:hypothetical protein
MTTSIARGRAQALRLLPQLDGDDAEYILILFMKYQKFIGIFRKLHGFIFDAQ